MKRKNFLRMESYDYSWSGAYFITICSFKKEDIFGEIENGLMHLNDAGKIIQDCWYQIPENYENVKLDDLVIMPNHIHGIIWIVGAIHESSTTNKKSEESPKDNLSFNNVQQNNGVIRELPLRIERRKMLLTKIIGRFKMNSSKLINDIRNSKGSHVWQRSYYDHIIRNEEDLNNTKQYIQNNPLNWDKDENRCLR
ncbi:MAG: transposase [Candidatus Cloacimonetes bacterium]|jgi:putative transposase|nr:transposase [Candidatus Cloacimonadota bacterium]